jgi:cyclophilin family peptidyl-prolyl cis-trans isomerase
LISAFASRADGALARAARRRAMRARRATAPTTALTTALALASLASRAVASSARFGRERLVMQTTLGDVTLALYDHDDAARATAAHVLEAFELGLYDTNHFFRVDAGFVAQIADCAGGRRAAMSERQRELATRTVRGEFDSSVKHARGKLSMARWSDPDSATSSFSVMLGTAPHLDGEYAVFGEMVEGEETLRKIEAVETTKSGIFVMPKERIEILSTYVLREGANSGEEGERASTTTTGSASDAEELRECRVRADSLAKELHEIRERRLPGN